MPLVSELVTKLRADTDEFNRKISGSENSVSNFAKSAAKFGVAVTAAVGVTAVAAFGVLLNSINSTAERIDELSKRAQKFSIDVGELQALEYAASLSGVSIEQLNTGLSRLLRTMGEAQAGNKKATQAFNELGLSAKELQGLSLDQVYLRVSEAIKTIPDANRQAQLAIELFGRSGVDQLNVLRSNLSETVAEFDKFGGKLTGEQAAAVEQYNDNVDRLASVFDAFKIQLTAQVAPALDLITKFITEQILSFGGLGEAANVAARFMIDGLILGVKGFQGLLDFIDSAIRGFSRLQLSVLEFLQAMERINFTVFGDDFNFDRLDRITKLQKELSATRGPGVTQPLIRGLESARDSIGTASNQANGKLQVTVSADKGLKVEVAESPEVTAKVNQLLRGYISNAASSVGQ